MKPTGNSRVDRLLACAERNGLGVVPNPYSVGDRPSFVVSNESVPNGYLMISGLGSNSAFVQQYDTARGLRVITQSTAVMIMNEMNL